ncbi:hotdog domain-containing protein [Aquirhabdus parva]|uniref:Tol-pal system-associated acyl-CoA thioesterase n=1 Tax=Aquirhabdus parva TaxID=2283318 RepID=A0A345P5U5_9GAMM|nr:hotdog domain-containing protein [Aquirhabdus parva]AXI02654.1 tol-pal system-associated acyl-CoA thioesterase [Aquirhabdus parva]
MPHRKFFSYPFRVYIEDTDAGGIVYHANHLKYMERTRTEWLRAQGIDHYLFSGENNALDTSQLTNDQESLLKSSFSFVVHQLQITYHQPAIMDDLLIVTIEAVSCGAASFVLKQRIERDDTINGVVKRVIIATAAVTLACLNGKLKPRRLPDNIRDLVQLALQD